MSDLRKRILAGEMSTIKKSIKEKLGPNVASLHTQVDIYVQVDKFVISYEDLGQTT